MESAVLGLWPLDSRTDCGECSITPNAFVSEVQTFRAFCANPASTADDRRRAYVLIVKHASMLSPLDRGYEGAGVALKLALCA